jgi:hypothetical protein
MDFFGSEGNGKGATAVMEPPEKEAAEPARGPELKLVFAEDSKSLVFDFETEPLLLDELKQILPGWDPDSLGPAPGEFNPDSVKLGRLKDQAKIDEKIEAAREKHQQAIAEHERKLACGEEEYWQAIVANAALSPITGRILAAGYTSDGENVEIVSKDEETIVTGFFQHFSLAVTQGTKLVGWNINNFDVHFAWVRAIKLGLKPPNVLDRNHKWLSPVFVDLMQVWDLGGRSHYDPFKQQYKAGLRAKDAARIFGIARPESEQDIDGSDFARLWHGTKEERTKAIRYLEWDIKEEFAIARAMGVV